MPARHPVVAPLVACHALAMVAWSLLRHANHGSSAHDLGAYQQFFYNLAHGGFWSPVEQFYQPSAHLELGLYWLAPFYRVLPHPLWLFITQNVTCALAAFVIDALARHATRDPVLGTLAAVGTLFTPQLLFAETYDFHSMTVTVLPMALLVLGIERDRARWVFASGAVLLSLREQMGLALAAAAVAWVLRHGVRRRGPALALGVGGLALFVGEVAWLLPAFGEGAPFRFASHYERIGGSFGGVARFVAAHPVRFVSMAFDEGRIAYPFALAGAALPAILVSWRWPRRAAWPLLIAAPLLAIQLYSSHRFTWHIRYHYGAPLVPLVAAAAVLGLGRLGRVEAVSVARGLPRVLAGVWAAGALVHGIAVVGPDAVHPGGPLDLTFARSRRADALARAVARVPTGALVSAQDTITPHLAGTVHLWPFGEESDDYVLIDREGRAGNVAPGAVEAAQAQLRRDPGFEVLLDEASVLLARRREPAANRLWHPAER